MEKTEKRRARSNSQITRRPIKSIEHFKVTNCPEYE